MSQINSITLVNLYLTILSLGLTMISVSKTYSDSSYISLIRKCTHTLSCILFFVMSWQTCIYFLFLRDAYHQKLMKDQSNMSLQFFVNLAKWLTLLPQTSLLLNFFALSHFMLTLKHSNFTILLFIFWQLSKYFQTYSPKTSNITVDAITFAIYIIVFWAIQYIIVFIQRILCSFKISSKEVSQASKKK